MMYDERPRAGSLDGGAAQGPTGGPARGESAGNQQAYVGPTPIPAAAQQQGVTPAPRVQVTGPVLPIEGRAKAHPQPAQPDAQSPWAASRPIDREDLPSSYRPAAHAAPTPAAAPYGPAPYAPAPQSPASHRPSARPPRARAPSRRPDVPAGARPTKPLMSRQACMMAVTALIVGAFSGLTVLVLGGWFPSRSATPPPVATPPLLPPLLPPLPVTASPTQAAPAEAPAPAAEIEVPIDDPALAETPSRPAHTSKGTEKAPAAPAEPAVASPAPGPTAPPATAAAPAPAPAEPAATAAPAPSPPATPAPPSTTKKPSIVKDIF